MAALDVGADDDRIAILDAAGPSLVLLSGRSDFERRLGLDLPGARAVLPSRRRETAAVFLADGTTVREIGLPEPSPLPTVLALRDRRAAGDVAGALALVHPSRRAVFERIYANIAADLPIEAEFMRSFRVDLVREDRAIVVIESEVPVQGSLVGEDFPMLLVRGRGGEWMVLEY